ncbi:MAG: protein translocase subunit SecD [Lachnospiraceae bacterium]|nr:protein translocase subunit SecD [Lachnospiraceae bacterium]
MKRTPSRILFVLSLALIVALASITYFGVGEDNTGSAKNIKLGLDLKGGVSITYQVVDEEYTTEEFEDTLAKLEKRVQSYSLEAQAYTVGDDRITVDIPGEYDDAEVAEEIGKPGSIQFVSDSGEVDDANTEEDESLTIWLTGEDIEDAQPDTQTSSTSSGISTGGVSYVVTLTMTDEGAEKLKEATTELYGEELSIVYDGETISSPTVSAVISDGKAIISGMETYEEAEQLATTIRIGSLSLELEQISSSVVGAKLGNDAVSTSLFAGLIGILLVIIFMIIVYRVPGVVAGIALVLYTAVELLVMEAFNVTLTVAGIAGIILSIGMAVDANVIIYSRIREEIAAGERVENAIKVGFNKSTSAILDGNITTLIASAILMWRGSGTIQSFAQTLAIGIVTSMFTALVISRGLMYLVYHMGVQEKKYYGADHHRKQFNFLKPRNIFAAASGAVAALGLIVMAVYFINDEGILNWSVEFRGGTSITAEYEENYDIEYFNDNIKPVIEDIINSTDVQGQCYTNTSQIVIRMPELSNAVTSDDDSTATSASTDSGDDEDAAEDAATLNEVKAVLVEQFGAIEDTFEIDTISSTVSASMRQDAITSVVLAIICMLLYIWIRFKDVKFATSAIIALVHDVLIVFVFYGVTRISVDNTFIACMLTILGYSINATIVIFDRIRENLAVKSREESYEELVNKSISQTLTRSMYTTLTTFITIFMVFLLGVSSIRTFAAPLMVGVLVGGYSSVCITGALWYRMKMSSEKRKAKKDNE